MLGRLGPLELVLILVAVVLIFGVGRLGKLGKDLGEGISEFRKGLAKGKEEEESEDADSEA